MPSPDGRVPTKEWESGDVIDIKYLAESGVRNGPNLEATPLWILHSIGSPLSYTSIG